MSGQNIKNTKKHLKMFFFSELKEVDVRICARPNFPIMNLILLTEFHKFARSRGANTSAWGGTSDLDFSCGLFSRLGQNPHLGQLSFWSVPQPLVDIQVLFKYILACTGFKRSRTENRIESPPACHCPPSVTLQIRPAGWDGHWYRRERSEVYV